MTYLKKALSGEIELTKADVVFEDFILKTIGEPHLTATQKAARLQDLTQIAETPYQREVAKAYSTFAESMLQTQGIPEEWANRIEKAKVLALGAMALLTIAERKRLNQT